MKKTILLFTIAAMIASCNNETKSNNADSKEKAISSTETKQERNKKVIMASMESFSKNDIDGALKDAAPVFTDYADGSIPPVTNIDSLKGFLKMLFTSIENYKPSNIMLYADGDNVIAVTEWTGIFKNDLMGIKATGKPVKFMDADIFKLNDEGKIIEHRSVQNTAAVLMAAGKMQ
jgi:predicted ester cyclase